MNSVDNEDQAVDLETIRHDRDALIREYDQCFRKAWGAYGMRDVGKAMFWASREQILMAMLASLQGGRPYEEGSLFTKENP